jgi:aldo/keto reductase family protein
VGNGSSPGAAAAGTWRLGDLEVNRMGFGAMRLPQTGRSLIPDAAPRDRDQAIAVLRRATELGVNHIDTAAFYFSPLRSANELINAALSPYPDGLVIVTKVGPARDPSGRWAEAARPDQLRGQVEENLRQLGLDHLDVVNLRLPASAADSSIAGTGGPRARTARSAKTCWPWHGPMARAPRRSGWPGRSSRDRTCWPYRAPTTRIISRPTWPPGRCGWPRRRWPGWTAKACPVDQRSGMTAGSVVAADTGGPPVSPGLRSRDL